MSYISNYLNTRRAGWSYDGRYTVNRFGENGFVAKIDRNVAGRIRYMRTWDSRLRAGIWRRLISSGESDTDNEGRTVKLLVDLVQ